VTKKRHEDTASTLKKEAAVDNRELARRAAFLRSQRQLLVAKKEERTRS